MPTLTDERLEQARRLMSLWDGLWQVEQPLEVSLECSRRLTASLARSYPERVLIRLSEQLIDSDELFEEALCHEYAHLVIYARHGRQVAPHGPEWRKLVEAAGHPARLGVPQGAKPRQTYVHRCPHCGLTRLAYRPMQRWRCRPCLDSGLDGKFTISSKPSFGG